MHLLILHKRGEIKYLVVVYGEKSSSSAVSRLWNAPTNSAASKLSPSVEILNAKVKTHRFKLVFKSIMEYFTRFHEIIFLADF